MSQPILSLERYSVSIHDKLILHDIRLDLPARGISALMGPGGAGKSTLVRTLSGAQEVGAHTSVRGSSLYRGAPLGPGNRPALVAQRLSWLNAASELLATCLPDRGAYTPLEQRALFSAHLESYDAADLIPQLNAACIDLSVAQRRRLAILAQLLHAPPLLCVDEPTADLSEREGEQVLELLERAGERAAVLFVTHNLAQARRSARYVALLAQGQLVEAAPVDDFFKRPASATTATYIRTGYCVLPADAAPLDDGEAEAPLDALTSAPRPVPSLDRVPAPRPGAPAEAVGPRGFRWLIAGRLGGTPQPGIVSDIARDVEALRRLGVTTLVCLLEEPLTIEALGSIFAPIPDMEAPSLEDAARLCARISVLLAQGETVAVHCKAGLGRTGTVLAAQLIWGGQRAAQALAAARAVEPRWVQSAAQERFLEEFEAWLKR